MARTPRTTSEIPAIRFIELTRVLGQSRPQNAPAGDDDMDFNLGEDDGLGAPPSEATTTQPEGPTEVTAPMLTQASQIRYYYPRRDAAAGFPGSEIHHILGHVILVQDTVESLDEKFPTFVKVHSAQVASANVEYGTTTALPEVRINPDAVREIFPVSNPSESNKTRFTFQNGNKLNVAESYDEVKALAGIGQPN